MRLTCRCASILVALCFSHLIAYDASAADPAGKTKPLFRDFMGINGHTVNFRPELYGKVCRLVRDYHPMDWDTGANTDYPLDFPFARNRVNWEHVYGAWKKHGFVTDACVMLETHPPDAWKDLPRDSFEYGKRFAESFGPSSNLAVVESVEIGNEPGKYTDEDYRRVFQNMARGIRVGDSRIKIATCNVNVGKSGDYHKSVECVQGLEDLYDVLNIHSYAMLEEWPTWKRSYPEDKNLPKFMRDIDELIRWRDQHAASKEVWVTEFGWDASTKSPLPSGDFAKWQGNSEIEQAQWLVRTYLLLATRDVQRAYLYFFNDDDTPQLHGSSGITRNYEPKPSFYAIAHLYRTLGDFRFARVVDQLNQNASVYEFEHESDPTKVVWVAWLTTGGDEVSIVNLPAKEIEFESVERMPLDDTAPTRIDVKIVNDSLRISVGATPIYCVIQRKF